MTSQARMAEQVLKEGRGGTRPSGGPATRPRSPEMVRRSQHFRIRQVGGWEVSRLAANLGHGVVCSLLSFDLHASNVIPLIVLYILRDGFSSVVP